MQLVVGRQIPRPCGIVVLVLCIRCIFGRRGSLASGSSCATLTELPASTVLDASPTYTEPPPAQYQLHRTRCRQQLRRSLLNFLVGQRRLTSLVVDAHLHRSWFPPHMPGQTARRVHAQTRRKIVQINYMMACNAEESYHFQYR